MIPHENGRYIDLKFDWNNLFLACNHCNGIKNKDKYSGKILDCCNEEPEVHILLELVDNNVVVTPKDDDEKSRMTATLIYETFNEKNTGIRISASENRLNNLKREMDILFQRLYKYKIFKNEFHIRMIQALLDKSSAFAGFKRSYVRENISLYPDLEEFII